MPKKKSAPVPAVSPSQPAKKMRTRSSSGLAESQDPPLKRTKNGTDMQDENCHGLKTPTKVSTRTTRSSSDKKLEEVNTMDKGRIARDGTPPRRGCGFAVEKSIGKIVDKRHDECPLEATVLVKPLDLNDRAEQGSSTQSPSRKRRGKASPPSKEKRSKQQESTAPVVSSVKSASHNSGPNINDSAGHESIKMKSSQPQVKRQTGLPTTEISPNGEHDPLLNRSCVTACDRWSKSVDSNRTFSVVSYNILAEQHRQDNRNDYSYTPEHYLQMSYRHKRISEELKSLDSDIICMQEVEVDYYNDTLDPHMRLLGFDSVFYKRQSESYIEGCATFYRRDQFSLLQSKDLAYRDLAEQDIAKLECNEDVKSSIRKHLNRPEVLIITKLYHKSSKREICIGNTHIAWTFFRDVDINCVQTALAMKEMVKLSKGCPLLLVGDFNTRVQDPAYQLSTDGYLNEDSIKQLQALQNVELKDGSKRALVDLMWPAFQHPVQGIRSTYLTIQKVEPKVTSFNYLMHDGVDYMWCSSDIQPISCCAVNEVNAPMPTAVYPSDHLSLQATYTF